MRYERYEWSGGAEWMLADGPDRALTDAPPLLIVPPLFEELNFTRAILAAVVRRLAGHGVAAWLIDLPGTGESLRPLADTRWEDWRAAVAAAAATLGRPHVASLRGGALLDDAADARSWWRCAPADGAALLRQMERAQAIGDREAGRTPADLAPADHAASVDLVGYRLAADLRDGVRAAKPAVPAGPLREMPFVGPPPWRRAEPAGDAALAALIAGDIAGWIASCGG